MVKTPTEVRAEAAVYRRMAADTGGTAMTEALLAVAEALEASAAAVEAALVAEVCEDGATPSGCSILTKNGPPKRPEVSRYHYHKRSLNSSDADLITQNRGLSKKRPRGRP